jgi:DNA mismatch repair protein MutS
MTPMMQQYLATKEKYKDCVIFFRLGDFYEMFFEDARVVSKQLDLVLTGRDCGEAERAPMCGIPYHSADGYIAKLIAAGFKVAICEQLTDPSEKGLVERDVVRVITSGTLMDSAMLNERQNNFIASIYLHKETVGLCWCDISTGELYASEFSGKDALRLLQDNLIRISPKEILCNGQMLDASGALSIAQNRLPKFNLYYEWTYGLTTAELKLKTQLKVNNLKSFGIQERLHAISAAGSLLEYLTETQKRALSQINKISYVSDDKFLRLDIQTRKNLELIENNRDKKRVGSLLWLLDNTVTSMGGRRLLNIINEPICDGAEINLRLNAVEELINEYLMRETLKEELIKIKDIERLCCKISYGSILPKECETLCFSLNRLPKIKDGLKNAKSDRLKEIYGDIEDLGFAAQTLFKAIAENPPAQTKDGGYIKEGYDAELDELVSLSKNGKNYITGLEAKEKEKTGIKNLKI